MKLIRSKLLHFSIKDIKIWNISSETEKNNFYCYVAKTQMMQCKHMISFNNFLI